MNIQAKHISWLTSHPPRRTPHPFYHHHLRMVRLPLALFWLVCATISRLVYAKDDPQLQGDNWCGPLMCVTAFVNSSQTVTCKFDNCNIIFNLLNILRSNVVFEPAGVDGGVRNTCRSPQDLEYLYKRDSGFGTLMENSAMVIMWWNSDGSMTLSQRNAPGDVEPTPDSDPPRVAAKYAVLSSVSHL